MVKEETWPNQAKLDALEVDSYSNSGSFEMYPHLLKATNDDESVRNQITDAEVYDNGGFMQSEFSYPFENQSQNGGNSNNGTLDRRTVDGMTIENESVSGDKNLPFTVERKDNDSHMHRWHKKQSSIRSMVKLLLALMLAGVTLFCVVASKLTVIGIAQAFVKHKPSKENLTDKNTGITYQYLCGKIINNGTHYTSYEEGSICSREVTFIMLCLILMIPPAYTLLKLIIKTCNKITHPYPTKLAVFWGAIGTLFETAGLSLFFVGLVVHVKDTDIILILMNALFIIPVISQLTKGYKALTNLSELELSDKLYKKRRKNHFKNVILSAIALLFQIIGIIGLLFLLYDKQKDYKQMIIIPIAITLIGIGWSPKIRKLQIDHDLAYVWSDTSDKALEQQNIPKAHRVRYFRDESKQPNNLDVNDAASTISSRYNKTNTKKHNVKDDAKKVVVQTSTSRGKATLINCIIKLVTIPLFMAFFTYIFETADVTHVHHGLFYITSNKKLLGMFITHIITSFAGYHFAWAACMITLQRLCFAIPLTFATPICIIIVLTDSCDFFYMDKCTINTYNDHGLIVAFLTASLWLGQFFATTYYAWKSQDFVMAKEETLFWVPTYDGTLLEQNMLLNRKNEATNEFFVNYRTLVKQSHVYICTTMYHEADYEMEQLLYSIAGVDRAVKSQERMFECHIWFDDGVRDKTLKTFAIQLISLLPNTVQVEPSSVVKLCTPYGMELKWVLPGGMPFHIHLKDNFKVKNKKRWSQVMYMSYVLDFRERGNHDYSYILTTDADVKFRPEDVSALMDFMSRDPSVGAVCGRTHPMGSGPMAWYQVFDYAIGHWLLKVAEHVMGSVLCSPGCFSVYRCRAVQDVLPQYASSVECAMDFLTKDMGEDRWFCTLMVERGWRLDYCASSVDITYCPEEFNEFFKQRRRWGPSTLANQALLVQTQAQIRQSNDDITLVFIIYQVLMLVSTIIGPGTVILLVSSGLNAAFPSVISLSQAFIVNFLITMFYVWICMFYKQDRQLQIAQILTFVYSMIMTITVVGLMVQVANDISKQRTQGYLYTLKNATDTYPFPSSINIKDIPPSMQLTHNNLTYTVVKTFKLQLSPPTLFLFFLIALFTTTALLHGEEALQLVHGIWYLLCLPSGYIFLMVYSIVNITDRSWGTREGTVAKKKTVNTSEFKWYHQLWFKFTEVFFCCFKEERDKIMGEKNESTTKQQKEESEDEEEEEEEDKDEKEKETKIKRKTEENSSTRERAKSVKIAEQQRLLATDDEEELDNEIERINLAREQEMAEDYYSDEYDEEYNDDDYEYKQERKKVGFGGFAKGQSIWSKRNKVRRYQSQRRPNMLESANSDPFDYDQAYASGYDENGLYIADDNESIASDVYITMNIEDWLDGPYAVYIELFQKAGYDDTTFLMGMKEPDLIEIGVKNRGHRKKILSEINRLPPEDIDQDVPEDVRVWLGILKLESYWNQFEINSYSEPNALADLKLMDKATLSTTFEMTKPGHLKKLIKAIKQLKYPTAAQRKIRRAKLALDNISPLQLSEESPEENVFWDKLRKICLLTEQGAFSQSEELHAKLFELRNSAMVIFAVTNILWLVIMMALLFQGKELTVLDSNFLSIAFLAIYTVIMITQFITLVIHRVSTWMHYISRTPFNPTVSNKNAAWAFNENELATEPSQDELEEHNELLAWNLRRRSLGRTKQAKARAGILMNF